MGQADLDSYLPTDEEPFMSVRQREFFRKRLMDWKQDILLESKITVSNLQSDSTSLPDANDRASSETEKGIELRTRDRQRKLISKIEEALRRIDDGSYGYCEETGEPISLGRLMARPIATLSLEAQERHERRERVHRDD
jgi:DnaK suppressor protein